MLARAGPEHQLKFYIELYIKLCITSSGTCLLPKPHLTIAEIFPNETTPSK